MFTHKQSNVIIGFHLFFVFFFSGRRLKKRLVSTCCNDELFKAKYPWYRRRHEFIFLMSGFFFSSFWRLCHFLIHTKEFGFFIVAFFFWCAFTLIAPNVYWMWIQYNFIISLSQTLKNCCSVGVNNEGSGEKKKNQWNEIEFSVNEGEKNNTPNA